MADSCSSRVCIRMQTGLRQTGECHSIKRALHEITRACRQAANFAIAQISQDGKMPKRTDDFATGTSRNGCSMPSRGLATEEWRLTVQPGLHTAAGRTVTHKGLPCTQRSRYAFLDLCAWTKRHWTETEAAIRPTGNEQAAQRLTDSL
jgi:hypothetical protein